MARYLNSEMKRKLVVLSSYASFCETILPYLKNKEAEKYVKTSKTFIEKAIVAILQPLPADEQAAVVRQAHSFKLEAVPVSQVKSTDKEAVDFSVIEDLASEAIGRNCTGCKGLADCGLRSALLALGIEPNISEKELNCPYEQ